MYYSYNIRLNQIGTHSVFFLQQSWQKFLPPLSHCQLPSYQVLKTIHWFFNNSRLWPWLWQAVNGIKRGARGELEISTAKEEANSLTRWRKKIVGHLTKSNFAQLTTCFENYFSIFQLFSGRNWFQFEIETHFKEFLWYALWNLVCTSLAEF